MTEILVDIIDASKCFSQGEGNIWAIADASCRLMAGERVAVVGPSGCGKSTLLNLMAGLDAPSSGSVQWPALGPGLRLRPDYISAVFQTASLMPALTSIENVELPIVLTGNVTTARARAQEALAVLGIEELASRLPEELSGGQAQRVAIARAIAAAPKLILADEPTGQLDQAQSALLLDQLIDWLGRSDTALVITTHDEAVARRMDQTWRMVHGHLSAKPMEGLRLRG